MSHRIDTHHHIMPPKYLEKERDRVIASAPHYKQTMLEWTPQKAIDAMDASGIETAITSISAPGIWFGDDKKARGVARDCNDFAAKMAQDHKGRFGIFAVLPIPDVDGSLAEIAYAFDELKADGIGLVTVFGNMYPGDKALMPVWEELNRRKAVVYFHPTVQDCCTGLIPGIVAPMMEFPFDTTRAITSLATGGVFAHCPNIRFIFSHGGGTLPALAPRIASHLDRQAALKPFMPDGAMGMFGKLYYDVVGVAHPMPFGALRQLADISHLLYGSDYPFWHPQVTVDQLARLGLNARELAAVERDNALALVPTLKARMALPGLAAE